VKLYQILINTFLFLTFYNSYQDLDEVLPNRNTFVDDLFTENDLYITGSPPSPTSAPSPTPPSPTGGPCEDSPFRFKLEKDGKKIGRNCIWVKNRATKSRCKLNGVSYQCSATCNACSNCIDSILRFQLVYNGKKIRRGCDWVANKDTRRRCKISGVQNTCRNTCSNC
jgi:hypothetical protein